VPLVAIIEVPVRQTGAALAAILRVTNRSDESVTVFNPDLGSPQADANWPYTEEVYRTSLLLSYGYIELSSTDEAGKELPRNAIETWVTPVSRPRLELAPGESFEVPIPVGAFYRLEPGRKYDIAVRYGDGDRKVSAMGTARVT
jgi:hypothetical protein